MDVATECADVSGVTAYTTFTPTGMYFESGLTFDQWVQAGRFLYDLRRSVHWWIGDWLNVGEAYFGEMYAQGIEATGFDYGTLANDKWIASRIEPSRRRENLSFAHHAAVASLEPSHADTLLIIAETDRLTSKELSVLVKAEKQALGAETQPPEQVALDFTARGRTLRIEFTVDDSLKPRNVRIIEE
jgi:hypothetical protein